MDWVIEDRYQLLPPGRSVHFRYTDLSGNTTAGLCESWVDIGSFNERGVTWLPKVIVRRQASAGSDRPLESTFVSVMQPYETMPTVMRATRLDLAGLEGRPVGDTHVAVELELADGRRDLVVARDPEAMQTTLRVPAWDISVSAELAVFRKDAEGVVDQVMGAKCGKGEL